METATRILFLVYLTWFVDPSIGFAPSIDLPTTTPEPTSTTPDPATLPFFPDARNNSSLTVTAGRAAVLPCRVLRLGDRMVSWVKKEGDKLRLITFGTNTYVNNKRYSLFHDNPDSWELVISPVLEEDSGVYACQVSIHPPMQFSITLYVTVPILSISDDRNTAIHEKFYEVGSSVVLQCRGTNLPPETLPLWSKSDSSSNFRLLGDDITGTNSSWPEGEGMESDPVVWLKISSASKSDSGNYSCSAPDTKPAFVRVHVVEGEDSVAMQHSTNDASFIQGTPSLISMLAALYIVTLLAGTGLPSDVLHVSSLNNCTAETQYKLKSHKKMVSCREFLKQLFREKIGFRSAETGENNKVSHVVQVVLSCMAFLTICLEKCRVKSSVELSWVFLTSLNSLNFYSRLDNFRACDAQISYFTCHSNSINDKKSQSCTGVKMNFSDQETNEQIFNCFFYSRAVYSSSTTLKNLLNSCMRRSPIFQKSYKGGQLLTTFHSRTLDFVPPVCTDK